MRPQMQGVAGDLASYLEEVPGGEGHEHERQEEVHRPSRRVVVVEVLVETW